MPVNWPPTLPSPANPDLYPAWPPAEIGAYQCSDWRTLANELINEKGFKVVSPTQSETQTFFPNSVRCDENHQVSGAMLVSPDSTRRWPFCRCNAAQHKDLLVLWYPYNAGVFSAPDNF